MLPSHCHLEHPAALRPPPNPSLCLPTHPPQPPLSVPFGPWQHCPASLLPPQQALATRTPSSPRLLPRQRACSLQARHPPHSAALASAVPRVNLRAVSEGHNTAVVCSPVLGGLESSSFPTPHPELGTAREPAGSQDAQVSKPLLSPYPPVYALDAAWKAGRVPPVGGGEQRRGAQPNWGESVWEVWTRLCPFSRNQSQPQ